MVKRILVVMVMSVALATLAKEASESKETKAAETPKQGAEAMLKLLKERNYADLFQKRYTEFYKAEKEGVKPAQAIKQLSAMWERNHDMMLKLFEQLAKANFEMSKTERPQPSETGDIATCTIVMGEEKIPYQLYKMKTGLWGFRM